MSDKDAVFMQCPECDCRTVFSPCACGHVFDVTPENAQEEAEEKKNPGSDEVVDEIPSQRKKVKKHV